MKSGSVGLLFAALTLTALACVPFGPATGSTASALSPTVELAQTASRDRAGKQLRKLDDRSAGARPASSHIVGCWARLYDKTDFAGDTFTLVGPIEMPSAQMPSDLEWGRGYDSLVVGPRATITLYDREDFRKESAKVDGGRRVADLDRILGFFGNIRSVKLTCT